MKKGTIIRALILAVTAGLMPVCAYAATDYPHFGINNIGCDSCHFVYGTQPSLLPEWTAHTPVDIDDTQFNTLCWSCHNDIDAPYERTHSSLQIDNGYGDWTVECRVCHNPHTQKQFRTYGSPSYIYSGISTEVTFTIITSEGAGWPVNAYQGLLVVPNVLEKNYNYKIISNTAETLTVQGPMNLTKVTAGNTFAIVYGNLVYDIIDLGRITLIPPKTGSNTIRFFRASGSNSFADGDATYDGICEVCHTQTTHFRNNGTGSDQLHSNMGSPAGTNCTNCHKHVNGFRGMGGGAHPTHVIDNNGPQLVCYDCHQSGDIPFFKSGADTNGDGKYDLSETDVCVNCHSSDGVATAKNYWINDPGTWSTADGEAGFCGSCHDGTPGNTKGDGSGDPAPNIKGDNVTYGFYVTGHGKASGNYARLSWQASTEIGNPAANKQCSACHDLTSIHFNNALKRLKEGYQNDANNNNCKQCHDPGTVAVADPQWYVTYADYVNSAHGISKGNVKCTACHDVHGASGSNPAMTKASQESLCYQCHTQGVIQNDAISGAGLADDIQQAFSFSDNSRHSLGADYTISPYNYKLECVSCHNVHLVTGKYWEADQDRSPVTSISTPSNPQGNLEIWGDDPDEKMDNYGGTYKTPNGDPFSGSQLPNYAGFCNECHQPMPDPSAQSGSHGQLNFDGDSHGLNSANSPNGGGTCPDWYTCGKAENWNDDDCTASNPDDCWPVMIRGKGDQIWSRGPYQHEERMAGDNFVLSCTDCHEAHGSSIRSLIRTNPNGGTGTTNWNTMCNNCHHYYSDWHAGMSCGNASCHVSDGSDRMYWTGTDSLHRMGHRYGDGSTRTFNPGLVLDMRFENNLNDSGSWRLHGKWMNDVAGSFIAGKSGQAIVLNGGNNVQAGTRNSYWSTDEGRHGTWKYTEMKFNTTLEAWIYPTDDTKTEYSIFTKHTGYANGGYAFALRKMNGKLRAVFNAQVDNNGTSQGGANGIRGAYSSISIPLNIWTHVAATFDTDGTDRDADDPSAGRIRIYVNGEDVTVSDPSGDNSQPGAGETSMYAYSENSSWNQSICYNGNWCASEFSVGGFYGWQNSFIGRLDEAKVWNVTKDAAYFSSFDSQAAPYISYVEGVIGSEQLTVTFSEGVFTDMGSSGPLVPGDFVLTDTDSGRTIDFVAHTAGSAKAVLTLSSPLDDTDDINADTLSAASNAVFDDYSKAAGTESVTITASSACPTGTVTFDLNEALGSGFIMDDQNLLAGQVFGSGTLTGSEYSGGGDSSGRYIMFDYNTSCLQASTAMTIETRIKPTGLAGTDNYIRRILARDGGGNFQISVWRNNTAYPGLYSTPSGEASIALWIYPTDSHGGNTWKPVLTNYTGARNGSENDCPIVSDHWYQVKAVWDTNKAGGTQGQFFLPADIYIDDQGTDGNGAGESWAGYVNCTDSDQSLKTDAVKFYTGDVINAYSGDNFAIGANRANPANNLFNGLIDWITWKDTVD